MRWALAWTLYGVGDLMWRVFDQWLPTGMPWPIYCAYNKVMVWSEDVQGSGRGPWYPAESGLGDGSGTEPRSQTRDEPESSNPNTRANDQTREGEHG